MKRHFLILCVCGGLLTVVSCGPLTSPILPERLKEEGQKAVNESWEKALTPVDRFDHQTLLDILLFTNAYQTGVDKLEFRSEKNFTGGTVVMEIHFNRSLPANDRFQVHILSPDGRILRNEVYDRKQIEQTHHELSIGIDELNRKKEQMTATPEEIKRLEGYESRIELVRQIFPKPKTKEETDDKEKAITE